LCILYAINVDEAWTVFLKLYGAERHSLTIKLRLLDSLVVAATTEWL